MHQAALVVLVKCAERVPDLVQEDCERAVALALAFDAGTVVCAELREGLLEGVMLSRTTGGSHDEVLAEHLGHAQLVE